MDKPSNMNGESSVSKGSQSENIACDFLVAKGYKIIKKNFHFGKTGEIDIIAEDKGVLVFCEVKSKYKDAFGNPLEWITPKKQFKIRKVAEGYLYVNKIVDKDCRLDVIVIDFTVNPFKIEHLINAF
ncbi:MAG: YraN family protein [Bacteroidota bacterium]